MDGLVKLEGLKENTKYRFTIEAIGQTGYRSKALSVDLATTAGPPRFVGPIALRFDVVKGFVVSWDAGVRPDSATIQVRFVRNGVDVVKIPAVKAVVNGSKVEATFPQNEFVKAGLESKDLTEPPIITVTMLHRELPKPISLDFTIGVTVPKIGDAVVGSLSQEVRKVIEAANRPDSRFKWKDLAASTLKILAPVVF